MSVNTIKENYSIARDMKYEALYWALGFEEIEKGLFKKKYSTSTSTIDSLHQNVSFGSQLSILHADALPLSTHKSFVILECIDKLLMMGYSPNEIIIDLDNEYDIYCRNLYIKCFEWNHEEPSKITIKNDSILSITYSSRLVSGVIERRTIIQNHLGEYRTGVFENDQRQEQYHLSNPQQIDNKDFVIEGTTVLKYIGNDKKVIIPEGITNLSSCLFWDNQNIEEVVLPESLIGISGDTFYNCFNLRKISIPHNVKYMGNNPFAGCSNLDLINESPYFHYIDGVLYNQNKTRLIYCSIKKQESTYEILPETKIIGKHAFYLCNNLVQITIPSSVIKLENNPFSGCEHLSIINQSSNYHIINQVIYDKDKSSVIGCLNSIDTEELKLLPVTRICRNSFWNCKGIQKIILPESLETIGYNPFVGCTNIEFVSLSHNYIVYNKALFTKDKTKLVCYPAKYAVGEVFLPEETQVLERGAFSGASKLTSIHLHNVSIISKTCFTNCDSLTSVYCSDLVSYIGEWAFAHCKNLQELSVYKDCCLDNNIIKNSPTMIISREHRSNYVIESDNLFTLQTMNHSLKGQIKSILIDPPYNSHIEGIGYKDEAFDHGYLDFMKKRIQLSFDLLSDDGFLIINIDKGEIKELARLCKQHFKNLVKIHKWEKLHPFFDKNRNVDPSKKKVKYEYIIICRKTKAAVFNAIKQPYIEGETIKEKDGKIPKVFRCFGTNSSAKDEMKEIFGSRDYFRTPKPLKLMKELIRATTSKDSIVLDFFAGSGTVGHAVVDLNHEDGGRRNYYLVSNNESDICRKVTLNRMQRFDKSTIFLD